MNTTTRTFPRTMRQAEANPMAWWESAEAAAANEAHIRAMFDGADQSQESRSSRWAHRVIYAIALVFACAVVGQWLGFNFMRLPG